MSEFLGNSFVGNGEVLMPEAFSNFQQLAAGYPAVYEVIRIEEGVPLFFEDYMLRLKNSFALLKREMPLSVDQIASAINDLIIANAHKSGPVKLVFGVGEIRFFMVFLMKANLPRPHEYSTGVKTVLMHEMRSNPNVKLWNRDLRDRSVELLENSGAYEAILVNAEGEVTEASRSNVFFIRGQEVFTTGHEMILPGITRKKVLEICMEKGIPVHFTTVRADAVDQYDSCFLTGTARRIVPVRSIEKVHFQVGTPMLRTLSNYFENLVKQYIKRRH